MLIHVLFIPSALPGVSTIEQGIVSLGVYILYALFILNVSCNPHSTIKLENRVLDYLGRLSYGIYAYHIVIIYLTLVALDRAGIPFHNTFTENLILYTLVVGLTLGAAAASYRWYESAFLRLKARFSVVRSANMDAVEGEYHRTPNRLAALIGHHPDGND
jgi:peptidoglycan/LPS O-acetylase OafA/YrhL